MSMIKNENGNKKGYEDFLIELAQELEGEGNFALLKKGESSIISEIQNIIEQTNEKYFSTKSEVLLGDFVIYKKGDGIARFSGDTLYNIYIKEGFGGVMEHMYSAIAGLNKAQSVLSNINDYEKIKDSLIIRPLSYKEHKRELKDFCYKSVCDDIALVLYVIISNDEDELKTVKVPIEQVVEWTVNINEVFNDALLNTMRKSEPLLFKNMSHAIYGDGIKISDISELAITDVPLVTTEGRINGAIALFYPNVARKIGAVLKEGYYIAFTSVHEAMIHPVSSDINISRIKRCLVEVNEKFGKEESLTECVYKYNMNKDCLEIVE